MYGDDLRGMAEIIVERDGLQLLGSVEGISGLFINDMAVPQRRQLLRIKHIEVKKYCVREKLERRICVYESTALGGHDRAYAIPRDAGYA